MKMKTADMAQNAQPVNKSQGEQSALVQCYGQIGISAVAAAARYQGAAKNPAYAPVVVKGDVWRTDEAA